MKLHIGIDVSKKTLSVAFPACAGRYELKDYPNTEKGVGSLIERLESLEAELHVVMEATGVYSRLCAYTMYERGIPVSVINPKQYKYFAKIQMSTSKTDHIDAVILAEYGRSINPSLFAPVPQSLRRVKQKFKVLTMYKKQSTALKNLIRSFCEDIDQDPDALDSLRDRLKELEAGIKGVERSIYDVSQEDFEKEMDLASSVKGIGKKTAALLVVLTGGFKDFESAKQFAKFIGIVPTYRQSGTSFSYSAGINRSGEPQARAMLFMATMSAIQYNSACKEIFERLIQKGKPKMVAVIAAMHKLIRQVFGVVQSGIAFDNDYQKKRMKSHAS